jgi:hypothetical protein
MMSLEVKNLQQLEDIGITNIIRRQNMDFLSIIDQIKDFLREVFTLEFLEQIRNGLIQASEWIKEFIQWLYNSVTSLF